VAPLIEALAHEQPDVRAAVANALGYIGPAAAGKSLPDLVKLLKDDDHDVRYCAVRALDMFNQNAAPAIPDLIELMHDSSQRELARQWAIMALVDMHPAAHDAIVKGLIKASQNKENCGVSSLARQQVRKIDLKAAEAAGVR
jgi:HEAT repeat protein